MNTQTFSALESGAIVTSLDHLGLIEFTGEDTQTFLQGQLTNDTKLITETGSQLAGYCTAKGRLLATLLLWKSPEGICGQLHGGIAASVQKRLTMYVLRSKVKVIDATAKWARLGVAGNTSEAILGPLIGSLPQNSMETVQSHGVTVIRLHGAIPRFEIIAAPESIADLRSKLESNCTQVDATVWDWLDIHAGVALVGPGTQEEFVPQMVNLDLLDGINFKKGCYTGQEIVARTHYLGKVKRRTYLAHVDVVAAPVPGDKVFGVDSAEPVGMIVNVAASPNGGFDVLAEIRLESAEAGSLRLGSHDGAAMSLLAMPYPL